MASLAQIPMKDIQMSYVYLSMKLKIIQEE